MLRPAFSTAACPEWTLERVAEVAGSLGFAGVELRSFGYGSTSIACDPGLTDPRKIRRLFNLQEGVELACVASGCRFDQPVFPPVIGMVGTGYEKPVRDAKQYIDIASQIGAGCIRIYSGEPAQFEPHHKTMRRIVDRVRRVCDHARHRDVMVCLENAGGFSRACDLAAIIDEVRSPLLRASYDIMAASLVDDCPMDGLELLGSRVAAIRVRDHKELTPVALGDGELPVQEFVQTAAKVCPSAWAIFSWDRLWKPDLAPADEVLPAAAEKLFAWAGSADTGTRAA